MKHLIKTAILTAILIISLTGCGTIISVGDGNPFEDGDVDSEGTELDGDVEDSENEAPLPDGDTEITEDSEDTEDTEDTEGEDTEDTEGEDTEDSEDVELVCDEPDDFSDLIWLFAEDMDNNLITELHINITWNQANNYCEGLELDGFDDWRLPTIHELRSLIIEDSCPEAEECGLIDRCLQGLEEDSSCNKICDWDQNINPEGYGDLDYVISSVSYWSSTESTVEDEHWILNFAHASLNSGNENHILAGTCVRSDEDEDIL